MKRFKIVNDLEETLLKPEKKKKNLIPKAYLKKYVIPMMNKSNLMLTNWVPQTPKSQFKPCIAITLNMSHKKINLYFSTSEDLRAFKEHLNAILEEIIQLSTPVLQKELIMWLEYQKIADKMVEELYIKKTTPKGGKALKVGNEEYQKRIIFRYDLV